MKVSVISTVNTDHEDMIVSTNTEDFIDLAFESVDINLYISMQLLVWKTELGVPIILLECLEELKDDYCFNIMYHMESGASTMILRIQTLSLMVVSVKQGRCPIIEKKHSRLNNGFLKSCRWSLINI